jgi:RHS repeat-associated protein
MHVALTKYTANGLPTPLAVMYNSYKYDQLNRIKAHNAFTGASTTIYTAHTNTNEHKNTFTYDANGNILTQSRNGSSAAGLAMDNLTYNYIAGTNQLSSVADAVGNAAYADDLDNQAANNYGYDALGQLVRDDKEEIASIEWTVYGKIKKITRTSASTKPDLEFKYDAMGQRILKLVKPKASAGVYKEQKDWSYTYYVRDASGNVMGVYKRSFTSNTGNTEVTDALELEESQIYGSSRLGIDLRKGEGILSSVTYALFGIQNGEYEKGQVVVSSSLPGAVIRQWNRKLGYKNYELSNHLGNVLVTISDRKLPVQGNPLTFVGKYLADVVATNDYSAFGAPMVGRGFNSPSYRYGFNGKENEDEINEGALDLGARIYDARIGRMFSRDPRESEYPWQSTYAYYGNSPVSTIDVDGMGDPKKDKKSKEPTTGVETVFPSYLEKPNNTLNKESTGTYTFIFLAKHSTLKKGDAVQLAYLQAIASQKAGNKLLIFLIDGDLGQAAKAIESAQALAPNITIGNVLFLAHGAADPSGSNPVFGSFDQQKIKTQESSLKRIGKSMSASSKVILLSCHAGMVDAKGDNKLMGYIADVTQKEVYASKSWVNGGYLFSDHSLSTSVAYTFGESFNNNHQWTSYSYAYNNVGQWTIAKPMLNNTRDGRKYEIVNVPGPLIVNKDGTLRFDLYYNYQHHYSKDRKILIH